MSRPESGRINATSTSFDVLEYLVDTGDAVGVTRIANDLSISKSKAYNHLITLQDLGYVTKRGQKYAPSLRVLSAGRRVRDSMDVYQQAHERVENLAEATGETVELFVREERYGVPVDIASGSRDWSTPHRLGERMPLHANAPGKALLASLPAELLDDVLSECLRSSNDERQFDRSALEGEIGTIRDRGVSFSRDEQSPGMVSVSAPIDTHAADRHAALAVVGPVHDIEGRYLQEDLVGHVISTSQAIGVDLTK